jgi:hypothetical protein
MRCETLPHRLHQEIRRRFFGLLRDSGARRVVDIRLRNTSGLSGFAQKSDLPWFLRELCGID